MSAIARVYVTWHPKDSGIVAGLCHLLRPLIKANEIELIGTRDVSGRISRAEKVDKVMRSVGLIVGFICPSYRESRDEQVSLERRLFESEELKAKKLWVPTSYSGEWDEFYLSICPVLWDADLDESQFRSDPLGTLRRVTPFHSLKGIHRPEAFQRIFSSIRESSLG
jgi:hypothetical protein